MSRYGWKPSPPDPRDYSFTRIQPTLRFLPEVVYNITPPVKNQDQTNSCVYHAFLTQMERFEIFRGDEYLEQFAPRFGYYIYNSVVNGDPSRDDGAVPRYAIQMLKKYGVCLEKTWPFKPNELDEKPSEKAVTEAADNQVLKYYSLETEMQNLTAIATGYCFSCGIAVFESFEDPQVAESGNVPMPNIEREELLGYHMIFVHGYNRHKRIYHCQNSWGENWGNQGHFTLPFEFLANNRLASDFWVIQAME